MGLFDKAKQAAQQVSQSTQQAYGNAAAAQQYQQQNQADVAAGKIGVDGMMANPAAFGGPSTTALAPDDPLLQPVHGITLEMYAKVTKAGANAGITTEDGMYDFAASHGYNREQYAEAATEWMNRMKQSMVVGQQFNRIYMAS
jgi:hypothetical protein